MNAPHKAVLAHVLRALFPPDGSNEWAYHEPITDGNAEQALTACIEARDYFEDWINEGLNEFRTSGTDADNLNLPGFSRNYESSSVARQLDDGRCVAWVYWYGGGKHGEPEAMPWLEGAIFVRSYEETITVQRFERLDLTE